MIYRSYHYQTFSPLSPSSRAHYDILKYTIIHMIYIHHIIIRLFLLSPLPRAPLHPTLLRRCFLAEGGLQLQMFFIIVQFTSDFSSKTKNPDLQIAQEL